MTCDLCGAEPIYAKRLCSPCYHRQRRLGNDDFASRPQCELIGCEAVVYARGLCNRHYRGAQRRRASGEPAR